MWESLIKSMWESPGQGVNETWNLKATLKEIPESLKQSR